MKKKKPSIPWLQAVFNNRLLTVVIIILGLVVAAQGIAITALLPLKEIEPVYVEFQNATNSFVVVQRAGKNIRANQTLISMFLRSYVTSRETVDKITEADRYAFVVALSSPKVTENFKRFYGDKETGLYYQPGKKRRVHIIRDNALAPRIHQIELETIDTTDGEPGEERQEWVITLRYGFYDQHVAFDNKLQNPLGLQIEEYSIVKRNYKESKSEI